MTSSGQQQQAEASGDLLSFSLVSKDDLKAAYAIEEASYPADEAATWESLRMRQRDAGQFFMGAYLGDENRKELVGFVCGTLTDSEELEEETMTKHLPEGTSLCIHSVVVSQTYRRRGIALKMLQHYVDHVCTNEVG